MVRKFLYVMAIFVTLLIAGAIALRFWAEDLTRIAMVPTVEFKQPPQLGARIYDDPDMWISRPGIAADKNPTRWLPGGAKPDARPLGAAVFFVHPTSYLTRGAWNAPLDDAESRGLAFLFARSIASPFNASENLWMPRYRQAAYGTFLTDEPAARKALDAAYVDVLQAFDYFLATVDKDAPIVLAGHSQGSYHLRRLLHDRVAGKPLAKRVVAAYLIGWPVSLAHDLPAMGLPPCTAPTQTGCVISWLSYAEPAEKDMLKDFARQPGLDGQPTGDSPFLCSNPLTGRVGGTAPASANLGTLSVDEKTGKGELKAGLVPAQCEPDGVLAIGPPLDLGPYVLPGNNYHIYDIQLFWANLRADVAHRVQAWTAPRR